MSEVQLLSEPLRICHDWFEATMREVTTQQAHWRPPGIANPICAVYAHVVLGADAGVTAVLNNGTPLAASAWKDKTGLSEVVRVRDWHEWALRLRMDLDRFRLYARAVYDAWATYLDSLRPGDLDRVVDLSAIGMGERTVGGYLAMQVQHFSGHTGEIACLKGLQGAVGYQAGRPDGIG